MTDTTVDLEIRLEYQEAVLNDLSDVVAKQQGQIDRLLAEVRRLRERQEETADAIRNPSEDVPPPHY